MGLAQILRKSQQVDLLNVDMTVHVTGILFGPGIPMDRR